MNSMEDVFDRLKRSSQPFDLGMDTFTQIETFGSLTAFDFLEIAIRVNQQSELIPSRLSPRHVDRNGPRETLKRTLANEATPDTEVQSDKGEEILDDLVEYVETEVGLNHTAAIFDVESCLCTYHGELENRGPDWRGSCT